MAMRVRRLGLRWILPAAATFSVPPIDANACRPLIGVLLQPAQCLPLCHAHFCCCKVYESAQNEVLVECATQPECPGPVGSPGC